MDLALIHNALDPFEMGYNGIEDLKNYTGGILAHSHHISHVFSDIRYTQVELGDLSFRGRLEAPPRSQGGVTALGLG